MSLGPQAGEERLPDQFHARAAQAGWAPRCTPEQAALAEVKQARRFKQAADRPRKLTGSSGLAPGGARSHRKAKAPETKRELPGLTRPSSPEHEREQKEDEKIMTFLGARKVMGIDWSSPRSPPKQAEPVEPVEPVEPAGSREAGLPDGPKSTAPDTAIGRETAEQRLSRRLGEPDGLPEASSPSSRDRGRRSIHARSLCIEPATRKLQPSEEELPWESGVQREALSPRKPKPKTEEAKAAERSMMASKRAEHRAALKYFRDIRAKDGAEAAAWRPEAAVDGEALCSPLLLEVAEGLVACRSLLSAALAPEPEVDPEQFEVVSTELEFEHPSPAWGTILRTKQLRQCVQKVIKSTRSDVDRPLVPFSELEQKFKEYDEAAFVGSHS